MDRPPPSPSFLDSPYVVAIAGWFLPGLGYLCIGERARGITIGVVVVVLFFSGLLIGGVRSLEPPTDDDQGLHVSFSPRQLMGELAKKPWFIAQFFIGPVGIGTCYVSAWASRPDAVTNQPPGVLSHARLNEIGVLYMAVAGMLNLLGLIDSAHRAGRLLEQK